MAKKNRIAGMSPFDDSRWRAQSDLDTLKRAIEIKKDPKRLKAAQELAKAELEATAKVASIEPTK
jgi:hypothetical protein